MNSDRLIRIRLAGVDLQAHAGAQDREGDDEAGEARHHDQQAGRDRQDRQQPEHLDDVADGGAVRLADGAEVDLLGECGRGRRAAAWPALRGQLSHSNSSVLIRIVLDVAAAADRGALAEVGLEVLEAAGALDLVHLHRAHEGEQVLVDRIGHARILRRLVEHDAELHAQPDVARRGEVGRDRRQVEQQRIAGRFGLAMFALGVAVAVRACPGAVRIASAAAAAASAAAGRAARCRSGMSPRTSRCRSPRRSSPAEWRSG